LIDKWILTNYTTPSYLHNCQWR